MFEKKILFICLGNICRSPAAEGVLRSLVEKRNLQERMYIDSAGTLEYHSGESADDRMTMQAGLRGYDLKPHRARIFNPRKDFEEFDYIVTMDNSNYQDIINSDKDSVYRNKVYKITSFSKHYSEDEVPDPYYGGAKAFNYVLDLLEDSCEGLLERISDELDNHK